MPRRLSPRRSRRFAASTDSTSAPSRRRCRPSVEALGPKAEGRLPADPGRDHGDHVSPGDLRLARRAGSRGLASSASRTPLVRAHRLTGSSRPPPRRSAPTYAASALNPRAGVPIKKTGRTSLEPGRHQATHPKADPARRQGGAVRPARRRTVAPSKAESTAETQVGQGGRRLADAFEAVSSHAGARGVAPASAGSRARGGSSSAGMLADAIESDAA